MLDRLREAIRLRHYGRRTEEAYVGWVRRYILFHQKQQPGGDGGAGSHAVGRKNWLFAGSLEGARHAALLYSLVQSCKLVHVPPFDYLKDVLLRVATHPHARVGELTPKGRAATTGRPAAV